MTRETAGQKGHSWNSQKGVQSVEGIESHATHQLLSGSHTSLECGFPCLQSKNEMRSHLAPHAGPSAEGPHMPHTPNHQSGHTHSRHLPKSSPIPLLGALVTPHFCLRLPPPTFAAALLETKHSKSWKGPFKDSKTIVQMVILTPSVTCQCLPACQRT